MSWLLKIIFVAITEVCIAAVEFLADLLNNIFDWMYEINVGLGLSTVADYTLSIGLALVGVFVIKQLIEVYILRVEGDPDSDALEVVTRISVTVATMISGSFVIEYLISTASTLASEITDLVVYKKRDISEIFVDMLGKVLSMGTIVAFIQLIFIVITLVALIIFLFKAAKRGAELMFFQIILPIFALDLLTTSKEKWNSFKMDLLICIFGYVLQVFAFNVFMMLFQQVVNISGLGSDPKVMFAALGWLVIVLKAPKWLQKFSYSSGAGQMFSGAGRSAMYVIPNFFK